MHVDGARLIGIYIHDSMNFLHDIILHGMVDDFE